MKISCPQKVRIKDLLFYLTLTLYCAYYYIDASLFDYLIPGIVLTAMKMVIFSLLFIKWIVGEKYTVRKLIISVTTLLVVIIVSIIGKYSSLLLVMMIIISCSDICFDNLLKVLEINIWFWFLVIVFACKIGVLQDYTFPRVIFGRACIAHSLGYKYYSWLGYTSMALTMLWVYRIKKIKIKDIVISLIINGAFFVIHTTNLSMILTLIFILGCYCTETRKIIDLTKRIWKGVAVVLPLGLYSTTLAMIYQYSEGKITLSTPFLSTIVSRLRFSVQAFEIYGIHLFGTQVVQVGNTDIYYGNKTEGIYIDSGFIYSTIAYGVILTCILMIIYTWLGLYLYKEKEKILYVWLMTLMLACCVNNFVCDIINNPVILLFPNVIVNYSRKRKIKQLNFKRLNGEKS